MRLLLARALASVASAQCFVSPPLFFKTISLSLSRKNFAIEPIASGSSPTPVRDNDVNRPSILIWFPPSLFLLVVTLSFKNEKNLC